MKYNLATTKNGQFPINEISEGTEVLCHGEWVPAPKPETGVVLTCSFSRLPTTSFEKKFIERKKEVWCDHKPVLNEFESDRPGLSVRGYLHETRKNDSKTVNMASSELNYWYPRLIDFFGKVVFPNVSRKYSTFKVYEKFPVLSELSGNELSERNLEYYLEGMLRRRMFWGENSLKLPEVLDESDRMVLRLLDIDCVPIVNGTKVMNPVSILRHIRDDWCKSKLTDDMIRIMMIKSYNLPDYTPGYKILSRKEETGWILPGINPDVNCLSPHKYKPFDKSINPQVRKKIQTVSVDKLGRKCPIEYKSNNLWEAFLDGNEI